MNADGHRAVVQAMTPTVESALGLHPATSPDLNGAPPQVETRLP
jgi:hypothetical protein